MTVAWLDRVRTTARERLHRAEADGVPAVAVPPEPDEHSAEEEVPRGVRVAAAWTWRLLVIASGVYALAWVAARLSTVLIPVAVALLLSALLHRPVAYLRAQGAPRSLSAAVVLVSGLAVVGGTLGVVINAMVNGFADLSSNVTQGVDKVRDWLVEGPLGLSQTQIDNYIASATKAVSDNRSTITSGALSTASTVGHVLAGFFIVLFVTFFFLRDGAHIWAFLTRFLPRGARLPVWRAGNDAWETLHAYVKATVFVAFVDALGIGIGSAVLGVPLALPLGALVFLSSFIPVVGATLSGVVAILVALVAKGPVTALIMLAIVIGVQQLEGHVLQPFVMGRAVSLHPLAVILVLTAGIVIAGIVGGLIAVPILAVLNTAVRSLATSRRSLASRNGPPGTARLAEPGRPGAEPVAGSGIASAEAPAAAESLTADTPAR
ncbi:MAG: putative integral rane protein [Mycobacterium sp.]|nr:putative integral rane protein [Mycobacterium sp.]